MTSTRIIRSHEMLTQRMSLVRALYIVTVATNGSSKELDAEFREAVGDVLEGVALDQLKLKLISRDWVGEEVKWLKERS